jgi:hypothetical protein
MPKFENAANNILNQLSRTRAGQYSIIPIEERSGAKFNYTDEESAAI